MKVIIQPLDIGSWLWTVCPVRGEVGVSPLCSFNHLSLQSQQLEAQHHLASVDDPYLMSAFLHIDHEGMFLDDSVYLGMIPAVHLHYSDPDIESLDSFYFYARHHDARETPTDGEKNARTGKIKMNKCAQLNVSVDASLGYRQRKG